ncbi:uncharacterized protein [Antedon mediterranea]|uniref:uncharacterized protein n=1 Tax=Antedon mediterranea TaxID=105859 RepID=UPI003AF8D76A
MDTERKQLSMSKSDSIKTYSLCLDSQFLGSSLNKANQQERRSEKFLLARQYEEAINCHQKAAEYLLEALETTRNVDTVQLLKLKYDHHKKQPARLEEMQRREKQRKQLLIEMSEKDDREDINENNVEITTAVDKSKQHELSHVETNDRYDSMENADSLLHIIKENTNEENGNVTFRISNLFNYFKANPLTSNQTPSELLSTKRSHFEKDKIIHELNVTIMTLVKNLYSCEEENKFLQEKISSLQNELEASRDGHNESTSLPGTLSTLFSTDMVDGNDATLDDHFQLNSLQPLPEIDLPPMPEM